ncbi:hypothetical protein [Pseudomonas putida]|nr:hypothetical protein [Pseudomonas putida]
MASANIICISVAPCCRTVHFSLEVLRFSFNVAGQLIQSPGE